MIQLIQVIIVLAHEINKRAGEEDEINDEDRRLRSCAPGIA